MTRRRRKRRRRITAAAIIAAAALIAVFAVSGTDRGVTGAEWLLMQETYMEQFEQLAGDTDDITALYLSGAISEEDFTNHVSILRAELAIMEAAYQNDAENTKVRNGTHTYATKKGSEAVPACFEAFYDMYYAMDDCSGDPDKLSYVYLAYEQVMLDAVADYETALTFLYLGIDEEGE